MKRNTYEFIQACLQQEKDLLQATSLYLAHQLGLPEQLRVLQDDEDKIIQQHIHIKNQLSEYEQAIQELTEYKGFLLSGDPT